MAPNFSSASVILGLELMLTWPNLTSHTIILSLSVFGLSVSLRVFRLTDEVLRLHLDLDLAVLADDVLDADVHEAIERRDLLRDEAVLFEVGLDDSPGIILVYLGLVGAQRLPLLGMLLHPLGRCVDVLCHLKAASIWQKTLRGKLSYLL